MRTLCSRSLMDATNAAPAITGLRDEPEFELECLYDDPSSPSELTIFSPELGRLATEWVTVDRSDAVRLDRMR
jgi:hypothetical protein